MIVVGISSVIKPANQAITSNTTLAAVTGLSVPLAANQRVAFRAVLPFALAGIVSGYKFAVSGPSSPTNVIYRASVENGVTGALALTIIGTALGALLSGGLTSIGNHVAVLEGCIENGANAGNLIVQAAQNVSDGSALTVMRGGTLAVWSIP